MEYALAQTPITNNGYTKTSTRASKTAEVPS